MRHRGEILVGKLASNALTKKEAKQLYDDIMKLMEKCDELDCEDAFGTEGWRHILGWDD